MRLKNTTRKRTSSFPTGSPIRSTARFGPSRAAANQRKKHALPDPDETFDPIDEKSWSDRDRVDELEEQRRLTQLALEVIETLPARDRAIVKKMYVEGKTQCEIAAEEGVAQSWVSRVAKSALGKVRREMIRRMEREK